uniref:Uncharacterized protein n=1 Tax=Palpitomonas bilix TaxID=652834 RepID=A0A7S3DBY4_9EUKA|mmetsp:Transcript_28825/g.73867  ORF Transcript_28825/g.73867 Transcript_28825/m.73867 type:complete len:560 (+) Transcript_28825:171-1850(+)
MYPSVPSHPQSPAAYAGQQQGGSIYPPALNRSRTYSTPAPREASSSNPFVTVPTMPQRQGSSGQVSLTPASTLPAGAQPFPAYAFSPQHNSQQGNGHSTAQLYPVAQQQQQQQQQQQGAPAQYQVVYQMPPQAYHNGMQQVMLLPPNQVHGGMPSGPVIMMPPGAFPSAPPQTPPLSADEEVKMNKIDSTSSAVLGFSIVSAIIGFFGVLPLIGGVIGAIGGSGAKSYVDDRRRRRRHPHDLSSSITLLKVAGGINVFLAVITILAAVFLFIGIVGPFSGDFHSYGPGNYHGSDGYRPTGGLAPEEPYAGPADIAPVGGSAGAPAAGHEGSEMDDRDRRLPTPTLHRMNAMSGEMMQKVLRHRGKHHHNGGMPLPTSADAPMGAAVTGEEARRLVHVKPEYHRGLAAPHRALAQAGDDHDEDEHDGDEHENGAEDHDGNSMTATHHPPRSPSGSTTSPVGIPTPMPTYGNWRNGYGYGDDDDWQYRGPVGLWILFGYLIFCFAILIGAAKHSLLLASLLLPHINTAGMTVRDTGRSGRPGRAVSPAAEDADVVEMGEIV